MAKYAFDVMVYCSWRGLSDGEKRVLLLPHARFKAKELWDALEGTKLVNANYPLVKTVFDTHVGHSRVTVFWGIQDLVMVATRKVRKSKA